MKSMRIQVNMSEKMVERVDKVAEDMGMSRSSTCNFLISQGVMSYEKANKAVASMPAEIVEKLLKKSEA